MKRWIIPTAVALVVAAAATAYATIPGADGVIDGCYVKAGRKMGQLRVIDAEQGQQCKGTEQALAWNQTGPQGPPGPPGEDGAVCMIAFETRQDAPELNSGFTVVSAVQAQKSCPGPVIGSFNSYIDNRGSIELFAMTAECVATGGLEDPCTVGNVFSANPSPIGLDASGALYRGTRGMDMVWPSLKRGVWLFRVYLRGTDGALEFVQGRTFTVTGYQ